jgi:general secretion pathway protein H
VNRLDQRRQLAAGFTLIELMVVVVIIGVVITATLLSVSGSGRDTQLEQERDRLGALIDYVRERAALQTVEYGLRCEIGDYRFVMYDPRTAKWTQDPLDDSLRVRTLPAGLELALIIEDHAIVLPKRTDATRSDAPTDYTPQVMLFSSGDLTSFKLTLLRTGVGRSALLTGTAAGVLTVGPVVEKPP